MLESVTLLFLPRQSSRKTCLGLHPFHCYCPFVSPIRHQNPSLDTWTSQRRCIFWIDQVKTGFCYLRSGYFLSKHLLQSSSPHHVRKHWSNAPKRGWVSGHISMHACLFPQRIWLRRWIHILHCNPIYFIETTLLLAQSLYNSLGQTILDDTVVPPYRVWEPAGYALWR